MRYNVIGKNFEVSEALKTRVESKLGRLEKLFPSDAEAVVTLSSEKLDQIIEVTIPIRKRIIRAEVKDRDMYAAIDAVSDVLEKQMVRYKNRVKDKARNDTSFKDELKMVFFDEHAEASDDLHSLKIEKTKHFALKPMDAEEAVLEMDLIGHDFFVFRNAITDEVNVVYRRKNGSYGLIEPEY